MKIFKTQLNQKPNPMTETEPIPMTIPRESGDEFLAVDKSELKDLKPYTDEDFEQILTLMAALYLRVQAISPDKSGYCAINVGIAGYPHSNAEPEIRAYFDEGLRADSRSVHEFIQAVELLTPERTAQLRAEKLRADIAAKTAELAKLEGAR
jgi:hypothetical protein